MRNFVSRRPSKHSKGKTDGAHSETYSGTEITTASDSAIARKERREVSASRHGICSNVCPELREGKAASDHEDAKPFS